MNGEYWPALHMLHARAKLAGVSYSLHYSECDDSWFVKIESIAPSERWCGRTTTFMLAVRFAIEWLDGLLAKTPEE